MNLNEYQSKAMNTCMPSSENFSYMFLNLVGEVGEFASKIAKHIRKEHYAIGCNNIIPNANYFDIDDAIAKEELKKEAGDILWQLAGLCTIMGWDFKDVAQANLDKLASRQQRGKIDGSGDNR